MKIIKDAGSAPVASSASDAVLFAGRYRLIHLLGEGDRKRTFLAEDTILPRQVALALIKPDAARSGLVPAGDGTFVHLRLLPGLVNDYRALVDKALAS